MNDTSRAQHIHTGGRFPCVCLCLGSNISPRETYIATARDRIGALRVRLLNITPIYESKAWGCGLPDFLNQFLFFSTSLSAQQLLDACQAVEQTLGRRPRQGIHSAPYESRTIDIDMLFYYHHLTYTPTLELPHPRLHLRRFILQPLCDNGYGPYLHPRLGQTLMQLNMRCPDQSYPRRYTP